MLKAEIEDLNLEGFDLGLLGFDDKFLDGLLEPEPSEGLTDEDAVPDVPETPKTVLGDVWVLGNHRLMCGDSTSIDAVEKLMDGVKADMVFTDPPYNIDYKGLTDKHQKIKNDKMPDADFVDFLTQSLMGCETMYVCCSWHYAHLFREAMVRIARHSAELISIMSDVEKIIPEKMEPRQAAEAMRKLEEDERDEAIKAAEEKVIDMRKQFRLKMSENKGALGLTKKLVKALEENDLATVGQVTMDMAELVHQDD